MSKVYGIDPGASGAICEIEYDEGGIIQVSFNELKGNWNPYKKAGKDLDKSYEESKYLYDIFSKLDGDIFVEDVKPFRGMSANTVFPFSMNIGYIYFLLSLHQKEFTPIHASQWQKFIGVTTKSKDGKKHKECIANIVTTLVPESKDLVYTPRGRLLDGHTDALGIAYTGMHLLLDKE